MMNYAQFAFGDLPALSTPPIKVLSGVHGTAGMTDPLAAVRDELSKHITPFLDAKALDAAEISASDLVRTAVAAAVSQLSKTFVLTPRDPLLAVIHERETADNPAALANRVVVLEMALAKARIR
jgi:hypothetical protein